MDIILALSITLAIELLVIFLFFFKDIKTFIIMSVANIILNVTMNMIIQLMPSDFWYYFFLVVFEIFTFIVEALILFFICKKPLKKSFLVSLIANVTSLGVGLLINYFNVDYKIKVALIIIFSIIYATFAAINANFYILDKKQD